MEPYSFQYHYCLCQSAGIFFPYLFMVVFPAQKRNFFFQMAGLYTAAAESKWWTLLLLLLFITFYTFDLLSGFHRKPWNTWKTAVPFP